MKLPIMPPYMPMEADSVESIPTGANWQYEPKWDGFRCIAFKDGNEMQLQSKTGQPLTRYFPELAAAVESTRPKKFVIDGEIVIPEGDHLSFEHLLQRVHPAESRVRKLSAEHPAVLVVFDILVDSRGQLLANEPLAERRMVLEEFAKRYLTGPRFDLSPATQSIEEASAWLKSAGPKLDGVVAKRRDLPYQTGERSGMLKIKHLRTADCVVGGFRYATSGSVVGSLLLGLYDEEGLLHHVGFTSGIPAAEKRSLTTKLKKLIEPPGFTGRAPGGPSRWTNERSAEWTPLKPQLVVEVQFDHFSGGRFRHGTRLLRWRPDKAPSQCTFHQVAAPLTTPITSPALDLQMFGNLAAT